MAMTERKKRKIRRNKKYIKIKEQKEKKVVKEKKELKRKNFYPEKSPLYLFFQSLSPTLKSFSYYRYVQTAQHTSHVKTVDSY